MENGSDGPSSAAIFPSLLRNGDVMANFSDVEVSVSNEAKTITSPVKVNGDLNIEKCKSEGESDSTDCDALVIDESVKPQKLKKSKSSKPKYGGFKGFKKCNSADSYLHSNPYFSESIFDLLEKSQRKPDDVSANENVIGKKTNCKNHSKHLERKTKSNPKLREYAQYLGLQPTVQFKCSKCSRAGFPSLATLNEHLVQCNESVPVTDQSTFTNTTNSPTTNIRVTRKVFLCSACGTYYENWNLFLHMREVHKRYICLYCLGMFSHPDKLSLHVVSKHNCVPNYINSLDEFYTLHKEPCFLMCCECQKDFTERDNFFDHTCCENNKTSSKTTSQKCLSRQGGKNFKTKNIEHVTADSVTTDVTAFNLTTDNVPTDKIVDDINVASSTLEKIATETNDLSKDSIKEEECEKGEEMKNDNSELDSTNMLKEDNSQVDCENNILVKDLPEKTVETIEIEQEKICDNKMSESGIKKSQSDFLEVKQSDENLEDAEKEDQCQNTEEENNIEEENNFSEHDDNLSYCLEELNDSLDMSVIEEQEAENDHDHDDKDDIEERDDEHERETPENEEVEHFEELRKVPKVTLKLPKDFDYSQEEDAPIYESDDSEKLMMEVDQIENETEAITNESREDIQNVSSESQLQVAGLDVPIIELELEQPLDKFDIRLLLQKCLRATVPICVYCNHARRISVNGKQLGLHAITEHRFSAVVNSITAEELIPESFVARIKDCFSELENIFFNLESSLPEEAITFSHIFECFQCRYSTTIHKELYLHNRKMHAKSILLCIMCKSNFYSYSELICHLCPGLYELDNDVNFRCCMCVSDVLPSAFRLMVHLRKRHHACDVCLELCHNQSRLSNHVWKHKLHHLCYRCGIAYRNKPDITKHLFWKHGTESVLCKKCLQKKWPHVYHFCIPPTSFTCEECNLPFSRAVSLMVHKRLHTNEKPHICTEENCTESFISKKLLLKHEFKHREPPEEALKTELDKVEHNGVSQDASAITEKGDEEAVVKEEEEVEQKLEKVKPKVDVYDLPELNLSESDSSDSEDDVQKNVSEPNSVTNDSEKNESKEYGKGNKIEPEKPIPVLETIWDDFRNYQANKEKVDSSTKANDHTTSSQHLLEIVLNEHDYCAINGNDVKESVNTENLSGDHDYCYAQSNEPKSSNDKSPKKKTDGSSSSDSSSDSETSCTCGSNCSCSSSSESCSSSSDSCDSDSSTSEGRRRQQARRERRKQKTKNKNKESENVAVDVVATDNQPVIALETPIQESDLETTETDTDEDFYDKQPQKLASKLLAEKKNQLLQMAAIGPYINGSIMDGSRPATPSLPEEVKPKKKSKSKKRKKKNKSSKYDIENPNINIPDNYPSVAPLTLTLPKNSPANTPLYNSPNSNAMLLSNMSSLSAQGMGGSLSENDSSLRASKRRRVPNRFYGYSSDEEQDKVVQPPVQKWRKVDLPTPRSPMVVPPITIKTIQASTPMVDPISIRTTTTPGELRVQPVRPFQSMRPPLPKIKPLPVQEQDSASDSNDSSSEEERPPVKEQPALYCYCRCPYDEVSEMIGCDASDCAIEWFHFECVGIMVPPKGQWFCPDCRKKKQQRRELLQSQSQL